MHSPSSRRSLLNYAGIVILIIGLGTGEFIYRRSLKNAAAQNDDPLAAQYESKVYTRDVQMYGGTFTVLMDKWTRALGQLGEPKPLAITISVVSLLAAGGCFVIASRMPRN